MDRVHWIDKKKLEQFILDCQVSLFLEHLHTSFLVLFLPISTPMSYARIVDWSISWLDRCFCWVYQVTQAFVFARRILNLEEYLTGQTTLLMFSTLSSVKQVLNHSHSPKLIIEELPCFLLFSFAQFFSAILTWIDRSMYTERLVDFTVSSVNWRWLLMEYCNMAGLSLLGFPGLTAIDSAYAPPVDVVGRVFYGKKK